jgi:hypothetical protein
VNNVSQRPSQGDAHTFILGYGAQRKIGQADFQGFQKAPSLARRQPPQFLVTPLEQLCDGLGCSRSLLVVAQTHPLALPYWHHPCGTIVPMFLSALAFALNRIEGSPIRFEDITRRE